MVDVGKKLLDIVISVFFVAVMLPIALVAITDDSNWVYNTTGNVTLTIWDAVENGSTFQTLIQVLIPLLLVISILAYFMPKYGIKARK